MTKILTPWPLGRSEDARAHERRLQRQKEMDSWVGVHEKDTKLIPLGRFMFAKVDAEDFEILNRYNWMVDDYGYVFKHHFETKDMVKMHRLIMGITHMDKRVHTDHINRDKLDNRKSNLRICSARFNTANAPKKKGDNPFKGVFSHHTGKWRAQIMVNRKTILLGLFWSPIEAVDAYNKAAEKYFGDFALLNVVPPDFNEEELLSKKVDVFRRIVSALRAKSPQSTYELAPLTNESNMKSAGCLIRQIAKVCSKSGNISWWKLKENLPRGIA